MIKKTSSVEDYPLSKVPPNQRKSFLSLTFILFGFTFFTATMWAGGQVGAALPFYPDFLLAFLTGTLLLALYAAALSYIARKSGLNTVVLARFAFGEKGSKVSDILLGFTQICWYAWGTATIAIMINELTGGPDYLQYLLMILFGFLFCWTAFIGYRGLEKLSYAAVPAMLIIILISGWKALSNSAFQSSEISSGTPESLSFAAAVTIIFGAFSSGGTQVTNWTRFADTPKNAVLAAFLAFFAGNGLMLFIGALGASVYQEADIVMVLQKQGLLLIGIVMLFLNIWTTQDNTIYNFSVAGCNLVRSGKRRFITLIGAGLGTVIALFGIYQWLVPFLLLLGIFIPPIGGIIIADFLLFRKRGYENPEKAKLPNYNFAGLFAYVLSSAGAYFSPILPPLAGILLAMLFYSLFALPKNYITHKS